MNFYCIEYSKFTDNNNIILRDRKTDFYSHRFDTDFKIWNYWQRGTKWKVISWKV